MTLAFAIQHRRVVDELEPEDALELLHAPHERVDRAARHTGRAFVDADQDELVVPQVAAGRQRHAVRHPLMDERVGLFEHPGALRRRQRTFRGKNPESGIGWKLIEGDTRHDLHIVPRHHRKLLESTGPITEEVSPCSGSSEYLARP